MPRQFSAARLRRSASFLRLTGITVAVSTRCCRNFAVHGRQRRIGKPNPAVPGRWAGWRTIFWSC